MQKVLVHTLQGPTNNSGNNSNAHHENSKKKKVYASCKDCGKTIHPEKNCFKLKCLMSKSKKKGYDESHVANGFWCF